MLPGVRLAVSRQYVTKRGITVRKLLICALALGGFAASAQAADLSVDSLKDPLPEKLSFAGVTVYGTIDVGYGYNSHGLPESSYLNTSSRLRPAEAVRRWPGLMPFRTTPWSNPRSA